MARFARVLRGHSYHLLCVVLLCLGMTAPARAASPTLVPQPGVTAPASIAELARALKNDVNLIYEYVYTNIDYSPIYGLKKGALGTLLDGRGNDFDQAALLVALLRQAGYTASYVYGKIRLSPAQLTNWLGVNTSNPCTVSTLLGKGGIPVTLNVSGPLDCTGTLVSADIAHVWVSVTGGSLGTTTSVYDPSFKTNTTPTTGINLASTMGYSQSSFLAAAESGATMTSNSIQNINTANLQSALTSYANNLVSYIKANMPTATLKDVVGGSYLQPITQPYTSQTSLSYETPGDVPQTWTGDVPDAYRTTLEITIGGIDQTYYADQVYGHRLSLVYNASNQPVLYLDGVVQGTGAANATTVAYTVNFPFCFATSGSASAACGSSGGVNYTDIFTFQNVLQATAGYSYAIVNGWDFSGRGMVEFHRRQLQANQAAGSSAGSEPVLGEALNMIGYAWLAQLSALADLQDRIIGSKMVTHCAVGVVGQVAGPYIDIPGVLVGTSSLTSDTNRAVTAFLGYFGHGSAFEWGTLDQHLLQGNIGAVSTVKLLDMANSQNVILYDATASNWSTIQPQLTNYASADLNTIQNTYINNGYRVILPKRGNITENGWTGVGYLATRTSPTGQQITYGISSNLKGGYSDGSIPPASVSPLVEATALVPPPPTQLVSREPIDLATGAYLYDHDDLTVGTASFPFGLTLHRSYTSSNRSTSGPLGLGWSHNFAINATLNSDGLKGLGQDAPIDGAAAIAEVYVAQNLLSDPTKPLAKLVIASLAQRWFMDRLIHNTVNVAMGSQTEQFMLLADGSYNPQLSSSDRLSLKNGVYTLQYKDGTTLNFNTAGTIATWQYPAGVTITFTYNAASPPQLISVANGLGRSLTLSYNAANQLTSVSDTGGRSVAYAYDSAGNLSTFTDPLGTSTTFAYTPPGGTLTPGLLTQIFYPSLPAGIAFVTNTYDSLGRVVSQANANNVPGNTTTWNYYFAGYRSEEDDASGTQHVLYYTPRGKVLFEIQDLAGLNRVTKNIYDGLDRLSSTTFPEGNSVAYTYGTTVNPWAHNIAAITRNSKPGSPLAATTTSFTYNATWNTVASATDARGLVSTWLYDAKGNVIQAISDVGTAPHFNATSTWTYDVYGRVLTATDPVGIVTRYIYDTAENLISMTADAGPGRLNLTTTYTYDTTGNLTARTDPRGNTTTMTYDAARRLMTTTAPTPFNTGTLLVQTTNAYDADGRVTAVTRSNGATNQVVSTSYTRTGQVQTVTDPNGNQTRSTYDLNDRLASVTQPVVPSITRVTRFSYDALGRLASVVDPSGATAEQYTYTANGTQASFIDARGNTTRYTYDGFDRLSQTTYAFGTALASSESYGYDADDNVTTRTTRKGDIITLAYDTLNRLSTKTPPAPAPVVSYTYDRAGRVTSVSDTSSTIAAAVPPSGTSVQYTTTASYDPLHRPSNFTWTPAPAVATPAASSVTFTHAYNSANQRTSQATTDNSWWYYPAGTSTITYTANALNQYTVVGAVTPTYDANGNLTADGTFTYSYDAENRLISATGAGNTVSYAYDAQGRRERKTMNGVATLFVTDADNREVLEYDGASGQVLRWYTYGAGSNDVLNQMDVVAGTHQTLIPDLQGSILATLDSNTGVLTKRGYLPYGASANATGSFAYAGQRIDPETNGLYYARARMYSPMLGRFLQPDPIGYDGGLNLYTYVGNDPLNRTDPRGLVDIFIGGKGDNSPRGPVLTYYRQYTQMHPTFITTYFEHDEADAIRQHIAVQPPGEPIKLVGHSYGAHTAAQVAASVNRKIDLLITIDPVGKPDPGDFVRNVATWVNVTAAPSELRLPDDYLAYAGGKGGKLPTEQATSTYSLNVHHGEFAVMMNFEPAGRSSPLNILRTTPSPSTTGTSVAPSSSGK